MAENENPLLKKGIASGFRTVSKERKAELLEREAAKGLGMTLRQFRAALKRLAKL